MKYLLKIWCKPEDLLDQIKAGLKEEYGLDLNVREHDQMVLPDRCELIVFAVDTPDGEDVRPLFAIKSGDLDKYRVYGVGFVRECPKCGTIVADDMPIHIPCGTTTRWTLI